MDTCVDVQVDQINNEIRRAGIPSCGIHGDKPQGCGNSGCFANFIV